MGAFNNVVWQLVFQVLEVFFLIVAALGLATGLGLVLSADKTVQIFHRLNKWVSTRHALKSVEIPRETDQIAHRFARWVAAGFVVGGIISVFGLIVKVDGAGLSAAIGRGTAQPLLTIAIETVRWFLVVGSAFGIVIGVMLLFYPNAEATLERYANMWVSSRHALRHGDDMNLTLDRFVEANPKPSGWVIACTSAAAVVYGLIMLAR